MIVKDVSKICSLFYNAVSPCEVPLDKEVLHEIIIIIIILPESNQGGL